MENRIRDAFAARGVETHTVDLVDPNTDDTLAVLFFDFNWRHWLHDRFLKNVPFEKRVLVYVEPANVNPTAYMPQSNYGLRKRIYKWYCENHPDDFDLYGHKWNEPITRFERIFGHPFFNCYRGRIDPPYSRKMDTMARYKFALCIENCATRPGYISEKIRDCFCSRTIPIYFGSAGVEKHIPRECFIDMHDFNSFAALNDFLVNMSESEHRKYVDAINRFIISPEAKYFSAKNFTDILVNGILGPVTI